MRFQNPSLTFILVATLLIIGGPRMTSASSTSTPGTGAITVTISFNVSPSYDFLAAGRSEVSATVNAPSLQVPSGQVPLELITDFAASSINATAVVGGITEQIIVTPIAGRGGTFHSYDLTVPADSTSFTISLRGSLAGTSFLWKYIEPVPFVLLNGWTTPTSETKASIPAGNLVSHVYDRFGNPLSSGVRVSDVGNSTVVYTIDNGVTAIIVQSNFYNPVAISISIASAVATALVAMGFFSEGRSLIAKLILLLRGLLPRGIRLSFSPRQVFRPRTMLVLFLLCAMLMVGMGVSAGPDPGVKAYVIADPSSVGAIQSGLSGISGRASVVTPSQDYTDFATMSSVGMFNLVVVSHYPPLALPPVSQFVLASLSNVPVIVVDNSTDSVFAKQIRTLYNERVIPVSNAAALSPEESQTIASVLSQSLKSNVLGLHLGVTQFKIVLAVEALLSFVLIFLGWAYLGSLISDSGIQLGWANLAAVMAAGIFVFVFSEMSYVEVSSLLAFPLSLHAVISGAKDVTAVGLLGFGGGSTPRLAAGFAGIVVGIVAAKERPALHAADFALLVAVPLILLANPFIVGSFAYETILLFVGNYAFGNGFTTSAIFKSFIYGIGSFLGGGVSPVYLLSAGKMLYFAGLPLLAYLRRMGRTTMSLAVLGCAFLIGDGGVRVGEMTPTKTFAAVMPGLFVGFAILGLFLGLATIEKYARGIVR